jgi:putative ABC transport system permease protein
MISEFRRRLGALLRRAQLVRDLREEMQLHIDLRARQLRESGMPESDAAYAARRQFGNTGWYQDESSRTWGWTMWERIAQDLRLGARTLRKAPGFTAMAVLTLSIGLGMNTAVYSAVNAVMLRSLPYAHPDRLVSLWEEYPKGGENAFDSRGGVLNRNGGQADALSRTTVSVANLLDYQTSTAFEGMASFDRASMNLTGLGAPERIDGEAVSAKYFSILGIAPVLGRDFLAEEDTRGAAPVVIITNDFWRVRMGGDTQVLERSITLDGAPRRIIGVLPPDFQSPAHVASGDRFEFYVPAAYPAAQQANRGRHDVDVIARLRPGVSVAAAQADLNVIQSRLARRFPATNKDIHPAIARLRDDLVSGSTQALWMLLGASGLLVLITCVNVANLLLVRAAARRRESSVRLALGAGRARLIRQFLAESLIMAAAGCAGGLALGAVLMRALVALAPPGIPRLDSASMDWAVFAVAATVACVTGIVFGLAPAWQASQAKPVDALKAAARGTAAKTQVRWRSALTVAEVGLSLVLLVGAGLLLRSFALVLGVDLGFQPDRVLAMNVNLPDLHYKTPQQRFRFFEDLEQRVRAVPGLTAAAYANRMPMRGSWRSGIRLESQPDKNIGPVDSQAVSPGYFETVGISLAHGRLLTARDREGQPPVAVVNRAFARAYWNGRDPVGGAFLYSQNARVTIVGVVSDIRRGGKTADIQPEIYFAAAQYGLYPVRLADFAVRAAGDPRLLVNAIRQQVLAIDEDQPVTNVRTMEEVADASVAQRRFQTLLLLVFAAVAVVLALVGIYGVLAFSVAQRTSELGIRIALGANPLSVVALVLKQAGGLIAAGIFAGLGAAFALTRYLQSLLFGVQSTDWQTYAAAVLLLTAAAVAASMVPAVRGARVDPIVALRDE